LNRGQKLGFWLAALAALHVVIACAGFFAPYDPTVQDRERPYAPPQRLHWIDAQGKFHLLRPFVYALRVKEGTFDEYEEDLAQPVHLRFLVVGARYKLLGMIPFRLHLFSSDVSTVFLMGSDAYGRDLFSRTLYGGQISVLAGLLAAGLALILGLALGAAAGFFGGWADTLLMRTAELFLALPWLYLLFAARAFLPLSLSPWRMFFLIVVLVGAVGWARPARLIRGVVLSVRGRDYVRAARGFGATNLYLLWNHVFPETWSVVLTQAAILVPQYILAEVTLSFLGLGVAEPVPSWGNLLASLQQYNVLTSYWWMCLPGVAMVPFFLGYLALTSALQQRANTSKI
jgi:peptide/nickel transport system permease protein